MAERFPDKPAAVFPGGEQVGFGALDDRSDRVAARLRKLGIALVLRGKAELASKAAEVGRVEYRGDRAE